MMKFYKKGNQVFAFEADGSQDHLIADDMVAMTDDEVDAHINPPVTADDLYQQLQLLCDTKHRSVLKLVLGERSSQEQQQRYLDKYNRALAGEFDAEKCAAIKAAYEAALAAIHAFTDLIELFRETVSDIIKAGDLDKAAQLIEAAESFNETTTQADVESLLAS